jgi:intein/homing endonuclease
MAISKNNFIDINDSFFSEVKKRFTGKDGALLDEDIEQRLSDPICQKCQAEYKLKYPNSPFRIKCEGIYSDYNHQKAVDESNGTLTFEEVKELQDPAFWANRYMVVKNSDGDIVPYEPRWYQAEILRCTAARKVDRIARGGGKALDLNMPLLTTLGWKTMGNINPNDYVFGPDGKPTKVTFVSDIMYDHVVYDVHFSDGSIIKADAEHLWEVEDKNRRKATRKGKVRIKPLPERVIKTTQEIKDTLLIPGPKVEVNYSIELTEPLEFEKKDLKLDPYLLGCWLGDGSSNGSQITIGDEDAVYFSEEFEKLGFPVRKLAQPFNYTFSKGNAGGIKIEGRFLSGLQHYNLVKNKHIPNEYLLGSKEQRLHLLQGLLDTDGCISTGKVEFCNTNENLADGVFYLAASLGMKPTKCSRIPICYNNGNEGTLAYRIQFFAKEDIFRIPRKKNKIQPIVRPTVNRRYIIAVKETISVPVRCIRVSNNRHVFLAGKSLITTHNTLTGIAEELWHLFTKKNFNTLVLCPGQVQSQLWYTEIVFQIENSPKIGKSSGPRKQQPFYLITFKNGASIGIFTAGSGSGKGATSVRGQSPDRVRLDEQDYLHENDYSAVQQLIRRKLHSTFHGSSTPTGFRSQFWKMCTQFDDYKEFYFPAGVLPGWGPEAEARAMAEARTMDVFRHEFLAEFGEPATGVFKATFLNESFKPYSYKKSVYSTSKRYYMGVDWNGKGTGTRICVVEYDPATRIRRKIAMKTVDTDRSTTSDSIKAIIQMNKDWHCDEVFIDAGFGFAQDEFIRLAGQQASAGDSDTARLKYVKSIDFGGSLELNKLVPNRTHEQKKTPDDDDTFTGRTKPFMVEGCVMAFEMGLVEISNEDRALEEQLRAYRVTNYTPGGAPRTFETNKDIGDHDLDAFMLALLAIELKYGLWHTPDTIHRVAQIAYAGGFGMPNFGDVNSKKEIMQEATGSRSRSLPEPKEDKSAYRISYLTKQGALIAPSGGSQVSRVPSRTNIFGNKNSRLL